MNHLLSRIQMLRYAIPRQYAHWRLGVTRAESRAYNMTDRVLLSFDDFGTPSDIHAVLHELAKHNIKALFFLQGDWAAQQPGLVQEIQDAGHWLGNHTHSHPHLPRLSDEAIRQEIQKGLRTPLLRPPYGEYDARIRSIAASLGFKIGYWTIDSSDWQGHSAATINQIILPRLHKGACILLHLNAAHTIEALPELIEGVQKQGFQFCHDGTELAI